MTADGLRRKGKSAREQRGILHEANTAHEDQRWSEYRRRLRRYVARRVDSVWADDVTGDILLRLLENKDRLAEARNPLAWAYRVAANVIADHYRRRAGESRALDFARADAVRPATNPDGEEQAATRREIEACLMPFTLDLPERYAGALVLTSFEGLSQVEAARHLGISVSGMKSRVQRARAELKRRLLACCEFQMDRRGRVMEMAPRGAGAGGCPTRHGVQVSGP